MGYDHGVSGRLNGSSARYNGAASQNSGVATPVSISTNNTYVRDRVNFVSKDSHQSMTRTLEWLMQNNGGESASNAIEKLALRRMGRTGEKPYWADKSITYHTVQGYTNGKGSYNRNDLLHTFQPFTNTVSSIIWSREVPKPSVFDGLISTNLNEDAKPRYSGEPYTGSGDKVLRKTTNSITYRVASDRDVRHAIREAKLKGISVGNSQWLHDSEAANSSHRMMGGYQ